MEQLGRSYEGRPIHAVHVRGEGPRILVVGCIHGDECERIEVTKLLERSAPSTDLWLVHQLNPDGYVRRSRFHQPQSVVHALLAGVPYRTLPWPSGSASRWQNGLGQISFVVEAPPGELRDSVARPLRAGGAEAGRVDSARVLARHRLGDGARGAAGGGAGALRLLPLRLVADLKPGAAPPA